MNWNFYNKTPQKKSKKRNQKFSKLKKRNQKLLKNQKKEIKNSKTQKKILKRLYNTFKKLCMY